MIDIIFWIIPSFIVTILLALILVAIVGILGFILHGDEGYYFNLLKERGGLLRSNPKERPPLKERALEAIKRQKKRLAKKERSNNARYIRKFTKKIERRGWTCTLHQAGTISSTVLKYFRLQGFTTKIEEVYDDSYLGTRAERITIEPKKEKM